MILKMMNDTSSGEPGASGSPYKPVRMCAACRKRDQKDKLIRIIRNKEGAAEVDRKKNAQARGIYLCTSEECIRRAEKTRVLARSLKCGVGDEFFKELIRSIKDI